MDFSEIINLKSVDLSEIHPEIPSDLLVHGEFNFLLIVL